MRHTRTHQVEAAGEEKEGDEDIANIATVHTVSQSTPRSYKVSVKINDIPLTMELDTGSTVTLVSETTWVREIKPACTTTLYHETTKLS